MLDGAAVTGQAVDGALDVEGHVLDFGLHAAKPLARCVLGAPAHVVAVHGARVGVERASAHVVVTLAGAVAHVLKAPHAKVHGARGALDTEAGIEVGKDGAAARRGHVGTAEREGSV